jgi:hypothetical protein
VGCKRLTTSTCERKRPGPRGRRGFDPTRSEQRAEKKKIEKNRFVGWVKSFLANSKKMFFGPNREVFKLFKL